MNKLSDFKMELWLKSQGFLPELPQKAKQQMAYKDFTFTDIENKLGISLQYQRLFEESIALVEPSTLLKKILDRSMGQPISSEKMVSEALVSPILFEVREINKEKIQLFSGEIIKADKAKGLSGECDFVLSKLPMSPQLKNPIIQVTEAKKGEVDNARSLSQTAAQMIGVRIFNQKLHKEQAITTIYGACTTGYEWLFMKLEGDTVYIDTQRYYLVQLPQLLGILQHVIDFYD
jgi:hypothetical protein